MKLPLNCEVDYFSNFLDFNQSNELFITLQQLVQNINYQPKTVDGKFYKVNFGKVMFIDQNLMDANKFPENLWGPTSLWTDDLKAVKTKIEVKTNQKFQVCVLIYYPDGNAGVGYHSDYTAFGDTSIIPSLSLGAERVFKLREKSSGAEYSLALENGSLIVMGKHCQERYEHSLPINPEYKKPRINLTFRKYGFEN